MTATSAVSSSTFDARSARSTTPSVPTRTVATGTPSSASAFAVFTTAWCSIADTTIFVRGGRTRPATPRRAMLSASVPLPVNTISAGCAPRSRATSPRASSRAARACWPNQWMLDAFPKVSRSMGSMASSTRGSTGVVALWSR